MKSQKLLESQALPWTPAYKNESLKGTRNISCDQLHLATIILYLCILAVFSAVSYTALYLLTQILDILYWPHVLTYFLMFCWCWKSSTAGTVDVVAVSWIVRAAGDRVRTFSSVRCGKMQMPKRMWHTLVFLRTGIPHQQNHFLIYTTFDSFCMLLLLLTNSGQFIFQWLLFTSHEINIKSFHKYKK